MIQIQHDRIRLGTHVRVRDRNRNRDFTLVEPAHVDPENGMISLASPIGKALLGRETGDRVTVGLPHGELILEILAIHDVQRVPPIIDIAKAGRAHAEGEHPV